ncbi:DNA primase [Candidatus Peregrinibacteria bacterium]|nr:DNA primase [Candidatus Peregrinibacteria bacterium]
MDAVSDIKARLSIEQVVAQYCQLQKKGRNFVALCPFHKDTHPSFLVSPDKGIAYCFACQTGGDIFSVYQKIEGVDFRTALKDLADKAGVTLPEYSASTAIKKDEKDRIRECLHAALQFYREQLTTSTLAQDYLQKRGVPASQIEEFELGYAPDSFAATYEHLLKRGFSRKEILAAGLGIQRELQDERIYDRFRNRLMFPIHDAQGGLIAFGGRTLGDDDAKYVNSSEGILYHKSNVLYGLHRAKEAMRDGKRAVLVEGYFDLLACHRIGVPHVVATSGTALTQQHVKLLRRYCESVCLCLDQDVAGQDAAERAFVLLSKEALHVEAAVLPTKDPADAVQADPAMLKRILGNGTPYLDLVLERLRGSSLSSAALKRQAIERVLLLLQALPLAVEREEYLGKASAVFGTSEGALKEDLYQLHSRERRPFPDRVAEEPSKHEAFSKVEIALALFLLYPHLRSLLIELIPPEEGMAAALYAAIKSASDSAPLMIDLLNLPLEHRERASILHLYAEDHGFADWSESLAIREIRRNCGSANREQLRRKQQEITGKLLAARVEGRKDEEAILAIQYQEVLKLGKMAG